MYDIGIINGKVYINHEWKHVNLYIRDEKIAAISSELFEAKEIYDANNKEVIPGIIDPHVHFELDLEWIKSVDNFYSGSVAAAYGGVTSIVDFLDPVDSIVDLEIAYKKRLELAKKSVIDYHFHATIKNPKDDLESFLLKMKDLGLYTLKLFTTYSDSNRRTPDQAIYELLKLSKKHGILILAHIENDELIDLDETFTYRDLNKSRPTLSETKEALKLAQFVRDTKGYLYMVHLSSGETLKALVETFPDIVNRNFFIESCPQYFTFTKDVYTYKDGYLYTFAPPLRTEEEQKLLFKYSDYVYTIGTDHCAFMIKDKIKNTLKEMPLGIGGVEHSFNIMREHFGTDIIPKMTSRVAETQMLLNKGSITIGNDADLFIYQVDENSIITDNHGTCDYSVYQNFRVPGKVLSTMIRGNFILKDGHFIGGKGRLIKGEKRHD